MVTILFDVFFAQFMFRCGHGKFIGLMLFVNFRTDENVPNFGNTHIQCEFKIDFLVFFVDTNK